MATYSGTSTVWYSWADQTTVSSTATTWDGWNQSTTSSATTEAIVWKQWNVVYYYYQPQVVRQTVQPVQTQQAYDLEVEKYRQVREKKELAEGKAKELLLDLIGKEQMKIYQETGRLLVKGEKHDWLITSGGSVMRLEKNKVVHLCVHSDKRQSQPESDNVVTLALHAKYAEKRILEKAHFVRDEDRKDMAKAACF